MQVEQVYYGSINRDRMKGYQIIGKSAGIDGTLASAFCKWAPSHNSLDVRSDQPQQDAWALSFFPLSDSYFAITRSVHGAPEYSGRGGFSVVSSALLMTRKQLVCYQHNPISIARTALSLGHLILRGDRDENLPQVTLPKRPFSMPSLATDFVDSGIAMLPDHAVHWIARESCSLLRDHRKVMIVGESDPPSDPFPYLRATEGR